MSLLTKYIRRTLILITKCLLLLIFKIIGPPRVLQFGWRINVAILKAFGAEIGENVKVHCPLVLHNVSTGYGNLTIKDNCLVNGSVFLDLTSRITLEKGVSLGPGVIIMTHNSYNENPFLIERLAHTCGRKGVLIKEGSGIKAGALIIHGITIGKNAVVGGNAVVNRDVPDNCFVAGVPARVVKKIE
jgi:acetyltransferase-like isoleucine patch superfamily enzyme